MLLIRIYLNIVLLFISIQQGPQSVFQSELTVINCMVADIVLSVSIRCKIYFYLEDDSIQVIERKVENSGIPQGMSMYCV